MNNSKIETKEINNIANDSQKIQFAYQTALSLMELTSQQIYSRFDAMLTANTIIVAILSFNSEQELFLLFRIILSVAGLIICIIWFCFIKQGNDAHGHFRDKAKLFEKQYFSENDNFFILRNKNDSKNSNFFILSIATILIFMFIYMYIFYYQTTIFIFNHFLYLPKSI